MSIDMLCFIPCCKTKDATGKVNRMPPPWPDAPMKQAWTQLERARRGMQHCVKPESRPTAAIELYQGSFYSEFNAKTVMSLIDLGRLRVFVISAGFGLVDALEPIPDYDAEMKGEVARYWRDNGLVQVISQVCLSLSPRMIYGFFAGDKAWSTPGAKYRYFYTAGVETALAAGLRPIHAGCFFREEGRGSGAILKALGQQLQTAVASRVEDPDTLLRANATQTDSGVRLGYERFSGSLSLNQSR